MRRLLSLLWAFVLLLTVALPSAADASGAIRLKIKGQGGGAAITAPVLASVSVPFGKWTNAGRGAVEPDSPTLGLLVSDGGEAPTSWDIVAKGGACANPGQWSGTGTGLAESASRRTPAPTGNPTTNCTWTFKAYNSAGGSNTVDYTVVIDPCAVQIGDYITDDSFDFGMMGVGFSTFYNATEVADGCPVRKILIAVGIQRLANGFGIQNFAFTEPAYVQYADPARPAPLRRVSCISSPYLVYDGLQFSSPGSDFGGGETPARMYLACNHNKAINNIVGLDPTDYKLDLNGIDVAADDVEVSGNIVKYTSRALNVSSNVDRLVAYDNDLRKWHRNGIFFNASNITDVLMYRNLVASTDVTEEETGPAVHPDNIQFSDGNSGLVNIRILQNIFCSLHEISATQGFFAGAGVIGSQPTDYEFSENLLCINLGNGIAVNGNGGASKMNDNTLIKFETGEYDGVEYPPEPGSGPWLSAEGSTAPLWSGTLEIKRNVTQDNVISSGFATPTLGVGADANVEFNNGAMTGFTAGNPQTIGEAYFAANESDDISMADLFTYLKTLTRRGDGKGWVDSAGAFKRSLP